MLFLVLRCATSTRPALILILLIFCMPGQIIKIMHQSNNLNFESAFQRNAKSTPEIKLN